MKFLQAAVVVAACLLVITAEGKLSKDLVHTDVDRTIDVSSQFARVSSEISVSNTGSGSVSKYYLAVPKRLANNLAYVEAQSNTQETLSVSEVDAPEGEPAGNKYFLVRLKKAVEAGKTSKITITQVFSDLLSPHPTEISQSDVQLVKFDGSAYFYTPYDTKSQKTTVVLGTNRLEAHTEVGKTQVKSETVVYGDYKNVEGYEVAPFSVHYENNSPFISINTLVKEVEVSHWGNVAIEEHYEVENTGAKHKGSWSRLDYQRTPPIASTDSLVARIPLVASDIYYRDEIGNISTSAITVHDGALEVDLRPRFPLYGGWKTQFYMGWNLPLESLLSYYGSTFVLAVDFSTSISGVVVKDHTLRFILPEGASDIEVHAPFDVERSEDSTRKTYLDTTGRVVVEVRKKNIIEEHNQIIKVSYYLSTSSLLHEPFLLITAFAAFFAACIVFVRLEFSITPSSSRKEKTVAALQSLAEVAIENDDKRKELYETLEAAIDTLRSSKNNSAFEEAKNNVRASLAKIAKDMNALVDQIADMDTDVGSDAKEYEARVKARESLKLESISVVQQKYAVGGISEKVYEDQMSKYEEDYKVADENAQRYLENFTDL